MTICEKIGKFQTSIEKVGFFGFYKTKVELDITWVSCGTYSFEGYKIDKDGQVEPKSILSIDLEPEWIKKSIELYPDAIIRPRNECYIPFYESFSTSLTMIDFGHDELFQAIKHHSRGQVIMTVRKFINGFPSEQVSLSMDFEDLKKLDEYLDNPNGNGSEIFYSGVQMNMS